MAKKTERLKNRQVETLKAGFHADGGNLFLRVKDTGARSWVFRWKRAGRPREIGIGPVHAVGLAKARETAQKLREGLVEGREPQTVLAALRPTTEETFKDIAERCIESKRPEWRSAKHAAQWTATLEKYAHPTIGHLPPTAVELSHVLAILKPIWTERTETATRVRQRIEQVLDYAAVHGMRDRDRVNPARWKGQLDKLLPNPAKVKKVEHHAALPYADLPGVLKTLKTKKGSAALAVCFIALTACRSNEARGARWEEFDLEAKVWTVPAARMKAGRTHRVPLPDAVLDVLKAVETMNSPDTCIYVFAGPSRRKPLTDVSVSKALHEVTSGATVHGMRSTFRDWASEQTSFPREVIELALAHVNKDRVEAAYLRSDLFKKRRDLMESWARHCEGLSNIVPLKRKRG